MAFLREIRRQPCQKKVGEIIKTKVAGGTSPEIALFENRHVTDQGGCSDRGRGWSSGLPAKPCGNPKKTGKSHPKENRAPAVFCNEQAGAERTDRGAKLQARGDHTVRQPSAFSWNVLRT